MSFKDWEEIKEDYLDISNTISINDRLRLDSNGKLYIASPDGNSISLNDNSIVVDLSGYATQQYFKTNYNDPSADLVGELYGNRVAMDRNKTLLDKIILNNFFNLSAPKQFLEDEDFDSLYEAFENYLRDEHHNTSDLYMLTALLTCSGIDFIPYLGNLTTHMFYRVSLNDKQRVQYMERRSQLMANPNCESSPFNENLYTNHRYGGFGVF